MGKSSDRGRPTIPEAIDAASLLRAGGQLGQTRPVVVVLTGPQVGQRILLEQAALIGRDPEADLMLTDEEVAWHHARIEPRDGGWGVVAIEGRTEMEGVRVEAQALAPDDQIVVGGTVLRFEVHDPVEQAYDQAVLERLNTDELTGLYARRKFDVELVSAIAGALRKAQPLSVIVLDLDGLKAVNDRHGHLVGAAVIAHTGRLLARVLAGRGFACRLGGDEFGVALPGSGLEAGLAVADAIRARVAAEPFVYETHPLGVRLSGGVAAFPMHGGTPVELLRAADEALYRAKSAGGDRIASA